MQIAVVGIAGPHEHDDVDLFFQPGDQVLAAIGQGVSAASFGPVISEGGDGVHDDVEHGEHFDQEQALQDGVVAVHEAAQGGVGADVGAGEAEADEHEDEGDDLHVGDEPEAPAVGPLPGGNPAHDDVLPPQIGAGDGVDEKDAAERAPRDEDEDAHADFIELAGVQPEHAAQAQHAQKEQGGELRNPGHVAGAIFVDDHEKADEGQQRRG